MWLITRFDFTLVIQNISKTLPDINVVRKKLIKYIINLLEKGQTAKKRGNTSDKLALGH